MFQNEQGEDFITKKTKALLELMGPQSNAEDRAKLSTSKYFDQNIFNFNSIEEGNFYGLNWESNDKISKENHKPIKKRNPSIKANYTTIEKPKPKKQQKPITDKLIKKMRNIKSLSPLNINSTIGLTLNNDTINKINDTSHNINSYSDNYLSILITAADNLVEKGIISMEELKVRDAEFIQKKRNAFVKCKGCDKMLGDNSHSIYCEECLKEIQKGNYCYYCNEILKEQKNKKRLIQCGYCQNWQHVICEEKKGIYKHLSKCIASKKFKYRCPVCRFHFHQGNKKRLSSYRIMIKDGYFNSKHRINKCKPEKRDIYYDIKKVLELDENNTEHKNKHLKGGTLYSSKKRK